MPLRRDFGGVVRQQVFLFFRSVIDQSRYHQPPYPSGMRDCQVKQRGTTAPDSVSVYLIQAQRVQYLRQGLAVVRDAHVALADGVVGIAMSGEFHCQNRMRFYE